MREEEQLARELGRHLGEGVPGAEISIEGAGVHWHVAARLGTRTCEVHCFWYGPTAGLMLGMSPNNAHLGMVDGGLPRTPRSGAEYLVTLGAEGRRAAGGRSPASEEVVRCMKAWLVDERAIEQLHLQFPFLDSTWRALSRLAGEIEQALRGTAVRVVIERDLGYELWAYGDGRSCRIDADADRCAAAFLVDLSQAAHAELPPAALASAVAAWTEARASLAELTRAYPQTVVEPHAESLASGDVARWHWQHVLDRARRPDSTLAPFLPLVERILETPSIASFFSFTSLIRLCFSSSSNYPFVTDALPVVWPARQGGYVVEHEGAAHHVGADEAIPLLEAALDRAPHRPFVGSRQNLVVQAANAELARRGRELRAELRQRRQWYRAIVERGRRWCMIDGEDDWSAAFYEEPIGLVARATHDDRAIIIDAVCRWVDDGAALEEIKGCVVERAGEGSEYEPE